MFRNLIFALLFYCSFACSRIEYPATYADETGLYRQVHGNVYHRLNDKLTPKGYKEYRLIWDKGLKPDRSAQVAAVPRREK